MSEKTVKIMGVRIDKVDMEGAFNKFLSLINREKISVIYTPNTEMVMMARNDTEFKDVLLRGDLIVPDGIGLIHASKIHHLGLTERVAGYDLMQRILKYCNATKKSIYIIGGKPGVAEDACKRIQSTYPDIVIGGGHHGYFDETDELKVIDCVNDVKPDILFVGLGAPKQEKWIDKHRKILNTHVVMGVGGSVDVWAGTVKRAPKIFQRLGLEWFYRLMKEPHRVGRMMALPQFLFKVFITRDITK